MLDLSSAGAAAGTIAREADVCVIGAGVAGQTVARRLAKNGRSALLVESGGLDFDKDVQALAAGPNLGFEYYELEHSRLRLYGGTTAIWGGRCVALDPIDFVRRDWVAHSGWPVSYDELDPYVDEAFRALELIRPRGRASVGAPEAGFDPETLDTPLWAFDEQGERFTGIGDLASPKIEIVLNATLTELNVAESGEVTSALFRSLSGAAMRVTAKSFVLAAGGVETPRLLLAAAPNRAKGLGNERDLVGRFFMEHPHARGGEILPNEETPEDYAAILEMMPRAIRHKGRRFTPALRPSEAAQERLGILNSALSFGVRRHEGRTVEAHSRLIGGLKHGLPAKRRFRQLYHGGKSVVNRLLDRAGVERIARRLARRRDELGLYAVMRAEQAPNPDSRVLLTGETDALGMRRAALDWRFSAIDRETVGGVMGLLDGELKRLGLGRVEPSDWTSDPATDWRIDPLISSHHIGGYHHIGTTRMGATPAEGVCDANCRVFGSPNLHIAGSSLFPTAGWANPTISIMALAMRLGDHLTRD